MKIIVTPVGTSLFTNYLDQNTDNQFRTWYATIKNCSASQWNEREMAIQRMKGKIVKFIKTFKERASAELQSISKIQDEFKDDIEVRLLASDTVVSRLAAEILVDNTSAVLGNRIRVEFDPQTDVINGLQIKKIEDFSDRGMPTLMRRISQLDNGQLVINITGGYKATVPYLTILSQIDQIPLFYTFEDLDEGSPDLIRIPQVPLSVDWQLVQYYEDVFSKIDEGVADWAKFEEANDVAINDLRGCIEVADNIAAFSWFGERFWKRYKNHYRVEINAESYFTFSKVWHGINTAIEDLYTGLNTTLSNSNAFDADCFETIKNLGKNSNLNHGGPINNRTFIFKSQRQRLPIRFAYSFQVNNKEITSVTIFEILREPFNHTTYVKAFKTKYKNPRSINDFVTLSLPKPD